MLLYGSGQHSNVVEDGLKDWNSTMPIHRFDDGIEGMEYDPDFSPDDSLLITIGNNEIRKKVAQKVKHQFGQFKHHTAIISKNVRIKEGVQILHGAVIQTGSIIGKHTIVNTRGQIDHDCIIGDYCKVAPGAILCGCVTLGEGVWVGAGATIIEGITIAPWTYIGAGAVVTKDITESGLYVGVPAKKVVK